MSVVRVVRLILSRRIQKELRRQVTLKLLTVFTLSTLGVLVCLHLSRDVIPVFVRREDFAHSNNITWCNWRGNVLQDGRSLSPDDLDLSQPRSDQTCRQPVLDPCHPDILPFDYTVDPIECSQDQDWVFIDNGTFHISAAARRKHGEIICEYAPLVRGDDDFSVRHNPHIKPMLDGTAIQTDFFKVACISASGARYHNIHLGVAYNQEVHDRLATTPLADDALGYNVMMIGFDSISRMSMYRNMPNTRDFLVNTLGVVELEGYNIVGDGTDKALLPILTGHHELEMPSAQRGKTNRSVDHFPWIWNDFSKAGYVTAWSEGMAGIGTFQYRLNGFENQPVDHYSRPYYLDAEKNMYHRFKPYCLGSTPRIQRVTGWLEGLLNMYSTKPKFMFAFHSENSHSNNNNLKKIDDDVTMFLRSIYNRGDLDRTILIFMSDHGARNSDIRQTEQGKLEERNPFFSFYFPPEFRHKHSKAYQTFIENRHRLTTPFDIHETFRDLLDFTNIGRADVFKRGISLFSPIPALRTCAEAGIEPHWCACLDWVDVTSGSHPDLIQAALDFINGITKPMAHMCARLSVKVVKSIKRMRVNSQMLKFKGSTNVDGHAPDMSDQMTRNFEHFQLTLMTTPGDGVFEVTVTHSLSSDSYDVTERGISRINRYGDDPACVATEMPHLRAFCYCN